MEDVLLDKYRKQRNLAAVAAVFFLAVSMMISIPRALRFRQELKSANDELITRQTELGNMQTQIGQVQSEIGKTQTEIGRLIKGK